MPCNLEQGRPHFLSSRSHY